ncbi:hypothetical protein CSIRO_0018 [Bradyrhizobiaceae bacterium SG-6C]|nr:hypothetical protein CSIRO_0018 [Bradyrhizobiaceae bacterium SG-6C]
MERTQLFDLMNEIRRYGMNAAFDKIMATAVMRHVRTAVGAATINPDLLTATERIQ